MKDGYYWSWTNPHDRDNEIEVTRVAGRNGKRAAKLIEISVSEERAMNSYNQTFTCSVRLTVDDARALRDHLTRLVGG